MATRENISVSITPQQAAFLAACVESGRYRSMSEVVHESLRLLEELKERRQVELDRASALIQHGSDQLDRGQVLDRTAFFKEWDEELNALEADQRPKAE